MTPLHHRSPNRTPDAGDTGRHHRRPEPPDHPTSPSSHHRTQLITGPTTRLRYHRPHSRSPLFPLTDKVLTLTHSGSTAEVLSPDSPGRPLTPPQQLRPSPNPHSRHRRVTRHRRRRFAMTPVSCSTPRAQPRPPSPRPRPRSSSSRHVTVATSSGAVTGPGHRRQTPRHDRLFPPQSGLQIAQNQTPFLTPRKLAQNSPNFCPKRQYPPCRHNLGSLPLTTTPLHRPFSLARNSSTPPSDTNASFGPPSCTPEIPRPPLQIQTLALDPPHAPPSGLFVLKLSKNPPKKLETRPPAKKWHFSYMQTPKRLDPPSDTIYCPATHKHQPEIP